MKNLLFLITVSFSLLIIGCSWDADNQESQVDTETAVEESSNSVDEMEELLIIEPESYSIDTFGDSHIEIKVINNSPSKLVNINLLFSFAQENSETSPNPFYLLSNENDRRITLEVEEETIIRFTIPEGYLPQELEPESRIKSDEAILANIAVDGYLESVSEENYFDLIKSVAY